MKLRDIPILDGHTVGEVDGAVPILILGLNKKRKEVYEICKMSA